MDKLYQAVDASNFIIIAGSSHNGKSSIAMRILERYALQYKCCFLTNEFPGQAGFRENLKHAGIIVPSFLVKSINMSSSLVDVINESTSTYDVIIIDSLSNFGRAGYREAMNLIRCSGKKV